MVKVEPSPNQFIDEFGEEGDSIGTSEALGVEHEKKILAIGIQGIDVRHVPNDIQYEMGWSTGTRSEEEQVVSEAINAAYRIPWVTSG